MSKEAVTISKMRSPVRRTMNGAKKIQVTACLGESFRTWRAKLGVVPFAVGTSSTGDRGWVAVAKANDRRSVLMAARRLECAAARQLAKLGRCVTKELARRKRSFFAATLRKLQRAHYNGDTEVSYRTLRQLGKRAPRQVKSCCAIGHRLVRALEHVYVTKFMDNEVLSTITNATGTDMHIFRLDVPRPQSLFFRF